MSFICHIHNYTEYNEEWNVFSAFNPSKYTHPEQWTANAAAPGEQSRVRCLAQGSHLSRGQFLPEPRFEPTTSGYKSNALSTRPRLPLWIWRYIAIRNRYLVPNIDILIHTISALNRSPCSQRQKNCGNRCRTISSFWPKALLLWAISMNRILFSMKMGKHEELKDKQISSHCISFTPIYIFMEMKTKKLPRNIYQHGP